MRPDFQKILTILIILIGMLCTSIPADAAFYNDDVEKKTIKVYEKVTPAVVAIDGELSDGISSGTGIIIDPDGIILTSSHVIQNVEKIDITFYDNTKTVATVMAIMGENNDLALLKISPTRDLPTMKLGDSTKIKVGQRVMAVGNPFGFNGTLTTGIISRIDYDRNKIQTDAAINPGSSGGPLMNLNGEVIGINQSIYNPDNNQSNIGIGFAVPVNAAKRLIKNYKQGKKFAVNFTEKISQDKF